MQQLDASAQDLKDEGTCWEPERRSIPNLFGSNRKLISQMRDATGQACYFALGDVQVLRHHQVAKYTLTTRPACIILLIQVVIVEHL